MKTCSLFAVMAVVLAAGAAAAAPRVVADIAPIHSLVARVMAGAGAPALAMRPGASPHGYALRPSEAAALHEADIVFWVGDALTPWLGEAIGDLGAGAEAVALMAAPGVSLLPIREGARFGAHDHAGEDGHEHGHEHEHESAFDAHIWLDPENAKAILGAVAGALAAHDPANAGLYTANAAAAKAEIDAMSVEIGAILAPARGRAFAVQHDAFHYFEAGYGIEAAGALAVSDATAPGPARVAALRKAIAARDIACVFTEPQFSTRLVETVTDGTAARVGVLDPLGVDLAPGPALYPALMRGLARGLADCLGR